MSYGLLSLAAQVKRAGHAVEVYNLSTTPWQEVVAVIAKSKADVYGISAFTSNRRGMGAVAALIRQHHPHALITAGGPFVTALPKETLKFFREIDTVVIGEGEETFMELLAALEAGRAITDIPGMAWRNGDEIVIGPPRPRINDLDTLASPFDYFTSDIVMTSRGCPNKCTFCGSFITWGKKLRFLSVDACLETFKKALARLPVPILKIKDDTFTADRRRAIAICDAIIANKLNFLWSCDSRVNSIDDELLRKMRLAGCQMISFGVESGAPEILESIHKETTPEMVLKATHMARKYGMYVRYYMILLNRGETVETLEQSNNLIRSGRPNRYFFSPLTFYPGTEEWEILSREQGISPEIFFTNDFWELSVAMNRKDRVQYLWRHVMNDIGTINGFDYTVDERRAVVDLLTDLPSAHVELAHALRLAGRFEEAGAELDRAEELGYPIRSILDNQRACLALSAGSVETALALLENTLRTSTSHVIKINHGKIKTAHQGIPWVAG